MILASVQQRIGATGADDIRAATQLMGRMDILFGIRIGSRLVIGMPSCRSHRRLQDARESRFSWRRDRANLMAAGIGMGEV